MWNYVVVSSAILVLSLIYHCNIDKPVSIVEYPLRKSYDYIVVGAGTAGCVVASRLSDVPNVTVLLIEAGGYFNWLSMVPLAAPIIQGSSRDWAYKTERQLYSSRGLTDYRQSWPRGKGLGGSGQLNYLVHSFGIPEDYDDWPSGWTYVDLYPYFQIVAEKMHLSSATPESRLTTAFDSLNVSSLTGNVTLEEASSTIKRGARWSTYHAYLQNSWNRENLHILADTLVTKILIDDESIAHGIQVEYHDGTPGMIETHGEVIVCAGAINTPQLLMMSGIGSADELDKHQIPMVKHLPEVGKNLYDHLNLPVYVNLDAPVSITLRKIQTVAEVMKYLVFETGLLASNGIIGSARVNESMIVLFGVASADEKFLKDIANFETATFRSMFPSHNDTAYEGFIYLTTCARPKSRGNVTLRSRNTLDPPLIEPAYLENEYDVSCTQRAVNLALETLETDEFRRLGANIHVPDLEECRHLIQDYRDPEYSECVIRTAAFTGYHPGGTCRIGKDSQDSVVDSRLRVHGIKNLRIADASVMPEPISGTPNSVVIAMAERAVDVILNSTPRVRGVSFV